MPGSMCPVAQKRRWREKPVLRFRERSSMVTQGWRRPRRRRLANTFSCAGVLLLQGKCTQRQAQVVAGGFVYFCTFRRPLLGTLNQVWVFIQSFVDGPFVQTIPQGVRSELAGFCLLVPLADFRMGLSGTAAASDASTLGGGMTASTGLTEVGTIAANLPVRGDVPELSEIATVLPIGLFDGVGGLRVAADAVGLTSGPCFGGEPRGSPACC